MTNNKNIIQMKDITVTGLRDGFFYLDGGAMFGVVPKVLWQKLMPADGDNRIRLGLNSLLIRTPDALILVETGIGTILKQKYYEFYSIQREPGLMGELHRLGVEPEDIDIVINTHLHFDHCGGNTVKNAHGEIVPAFPNARYIIQKGEWEAAVSPTPRDRASYLKQNFVPLAEAGVLQLIDGDTSITPGIDVVIAVGHTARHQCVRITDGDQTVFFLGDLVPTSAHVGLPYIMSYDLFPLDTLQTKERLYEKVSSRDWIVAFNHDPNLYFGHIRLMNQRFDFEPL
ncbi:MAG: MBL fold metallo-hydrolase [Candidatus Aminicenantes bacterium]|nr:MBL fold metallo-hydrolase [Candidatus Aminicenantes bacterium]